ncbi:acetyl-CoA C-acyltransferase [Gordonia jinghuaiqii]|uniref:Thiolase family protein n=1 Tax=Gordonia jinghuaiqii TaxID=2758710 RepID=A0A7D7LVR3_9ACTN|nr:thiolase family protein [Gordonia jinghuaiqii]MCR5979314.1 acetyl-CoA C-acyltransferase [Gordonia jinghuaiqii]QMT01099.1 thiolase family protein [Gordonia jinghuaiqii]
MRYGETSTPRDAVIVEAVRTPIGKRNGSLAGVHAADLSAVVLNELMSRTGIDPQMVDDVLWGCVTQLGDQSSNIGRFAVLAAGWPDSVPAATINRACGSGQQAIESAAHAVIAGAHEIVVAGGVETMSRVPLGAARQTGFPYGQTVLDRYQTDELNQGFGAELIAEKWGLSRLVLDEYASRSHELAAAAIDSGAFDTQVVPVDTADGTLGVDEGLRRGTTPEKLAALKPSFRDDGVIHAGNASQISDGAAGVVIMTSARAAELGLTPIARIVAGSVVGDDPVLMLTGPIPATQKLLARTGLSIDDIGAVEINEAFAPVPLAWLAELGADPDRLNPLGGAIAVGHPLGASGAILTTRLIHHMRDKGIRFGLQAICEGGGTANATLYELVD